MVAACISIVQHTDRLAVSAAGRYEVRLRAIDFVGNVEPAAKLAPRASIPTRCATVTVNAERAASQPL